MMKEPPSAAEAYRILMQEQTHQELSKGSNGDEQETPIACRIDNKRKYVNRGKFVQNKKAGHYCEHCKMHGHSMERCWKIHGYPPNYKPNTWKKENTAIKANIIQTQNEPRHIEPKLTQEQYNKLMCFLNTQSDQEANKDHSMAASAHIEGKFCLNFVRTTKWILDSGASDHICCDLTLFNHYKALTGRHNSIIIPDGAHVKIKFFGSVQLNNGLKLHGVLYVPDFKYNLISVHRLCLDKKIKISFVADLCVM